VLWKHSLQFNNGGFHKASGGGGYVDGERCYSPRTPANKGLWFGIRRCLRSPNLSTFSRQKRLGPAYAGNIRIGRRPCDHPIIHFSYQRGCVSMFDRLHARGPGIIPSFERGREGCVHIARDKTPLLTVPHRSRNPLIFGKGVRVPENEGHGVGQSELGI
jgi:hypothetical protein